MSGQSIVYDSEGTQARIIGDESEGDRILLRLADGKNIHVQRGILQQDAEGRYRIALRFSELETVAGERAVLPVLEEEISVRKEEVDQARVLVRKTVQERTETIDETLFEERVNVERTPVNRVVDAPIPIRYEDDGTVIVSLVEEVLVVEKRLMLTEELRISKERHEVHKPQTVTLRKEEAQVERIPSEHKNDDTTGSL